MSRIAERLKQLGIELPSVPPPEPDEPEVPAVGRRHQLDDEARLAVPAGADDDSLVAPVHAVILARKLDSHDAVALGIVGPVLRYGPERNLARVLILGCGRVYGFAAVGDGLEPVVKEIIGLCAHQLVGVASGFHHKVETGGACKAQGSGLGHAGLYPIGDSIVRETSGVDSGIRTGLTSQPRKNIRRGCIGSSLSRSNTARHHSGFSCRLQYAKHLF